MAFPNMLICSLFHSRLLVVVPTPHLKLCPNMASIPFSDIFALLAGLSDRL